MTRGERAAQPAAHGRFRRISQDSNSAHGLPRPRPRENDRNRKRKKRQKYSNREEKKITRYQVVGDGPASVRAGGPRARRRSAPSESSAPRAPVTQSRGRRADVTARRCLSGRGASGAPSRSWQGCVARWRRSLRLCGGGRRPQRRSCGRCPCSEVSAAASGPRRRGAGGGARAPGAHFPETAAGRAERSHGLGRCGRRAEGLGGLSLLVEAFS